MEHVTGLPRQSPYDSNLTLGRALISIGHSVAVLTDLVEHLGAPEEHPPGEWHQLVQGIIEALQRFQRRLDE